MKKFEYLQKSLNISADGTATILYNGTRLDFNEYGTAIINKLGQEGWELITQVSVTSTEFESQALVPMLHPDAVASNVLIEMEKDIYEKIDLRIAAEATS